MTNYEAKIAFIQIGVHAYNDVVFSAPSASENHNYIVTCIDGVAQSCQCEWTQKGGWTRELKDGSSHKCAHALAVEQYIAEEQRKAAAQAVQAAETIVSEPVPVEVVKEVEKPAYIRCNGGMVRRDAQERNRARGEFSFLR